MSSEPEDDGFEPNDIINRAQHFKGSMKKYWNQRYDIFEKYDNGILLTKELWFSVTPESISKFTAKFINAAFKGKNGPVKIMDAFCGGGGNIVQFLMYSDIVYAADINKLHLHCTFNNCMVYIDKPTLDEKLKLLPLDWTVVDHFKDWQHFDQSSLDADTYATIAESMTNIQTFQNGEFDCIFGSPPWGGPDYINQKTFDLDNLLPFTLEKLLRILSRFTGQIALFLPKNSDLEQLKAITERVFGSGSVVRVLRMSIQGRAKGLLVCWGKEFDNVDLVDIRL
ncbi:RNA methyltransferase [Martiniozyma asiatica (nom. inval.)]|nr:RNA methyltransferase [Martiniozyma asiatica]